MLVILTLITNTLRWFFTFQIIMIIADQSKSPKTYKISLVYSLIAGSLQLYKNYLLTHLMLASIAFILMISIIILASYQLTHKKLIWCIDLLGGIELLMLPLSLVFIIDKQLIHISNILVYHLMVNLLMISTTLGFLYFLKRKISDKDLEIIRLQFDSFHIIFILFYPFQVLYGIILTVFKLIHIYDYYTIYLLGNLASLIPSIFAAFLLFIHIHKHKKIISYQNRALKTYSQIINDQYTFIRHYRHDIYNILLGVKFIAKDKGTQEAKRYLEEQVISSVDTHYSDMAFVNVHVKDPLIKSILYELLHEAKQANASIYLTFSEPNYHLEAAPPRVIFKTQERLNKKLHKLLNTGKKDVNQEFNQDVKQDPLRLKLIIYPDIKDWQLIRP